MGNTQAEKSRNHSEPSPHSTSQASVSVPSSPQAILALGRAAGNRAVGQMIGDGRLRVNRDAEPTTRPVDTAEPVAEAGGPSVGLLVNPRAQPEIAEEKSTTPGDEETTQGTLERMLAFMGEYSPDDAWILPIEEVKERNEGWLAAKFERTDYIELPFSEIWAMNATEASVTDALLAHLFEGKERGPRTFARIRNSLNIRSWGGSAAEIGNDEAIRANLLAILRVDPTATTFKYQIKPGTLGVIEEAYRRLRAFEVKRGREIYEEQAEETGQMVFDFYRAHANGVIRVVNGGVSLALENHRRLGLIDDVPQIDELKMKSKWGQENKRTMELGIDLALLFVGGFAAAGTKAAAAGGSLEVRAVSVGGLNVGGSTQP